MVGLTSFPFKPTHAALFLWKDLSVNTASRSKYSVLYWWDEIVRLCFQLVLILKQSFKLKIELRPGLKIFLNTWGKMWSFFFHYFLSLHVSVCKSPVPSSQLAFPFNKFLMFNYCPIHPKGRLPANHPQNAILRCSVSHGSARSAYVPKQSSYGYQFTINYCYTTIPRKLVISEALSWYLGRVLEPVSIAALLLNCCSSQSD